MRVVDALGHELHFASPPRRIVSLVPSETETAFEVFGAANVVGRTEFCIEPRGRVEALPSVGGTKSVDVGAVRALAPDLVLANQEENARGAVEKLRALGIPVHVSFPCTVEASAAYVEAMCRLAGRGAGDPIAKAQRALVAEVHAAADSGDATGPRPAVFVPIWKEPWMTFDGRTFASDLLAHAGVTNVFADRARRYPLPADLGRMEPVDAGERDTRYPRVTLDEVRRRAPSLALLPDEPYAFTDAERLELERALLACGTRVEHVDGKDLFWYGVRVPRALARLRARFEPTV
ncbi:MAG: helical backbone metal receptor [Polyangiales bacterium]|nr:ABC transporter substrate-binding protein [Myxococcales bacterium]